MRGNFKHIYHITDFERISDVNYRSKMLTLIFPTTPVIILKRFVFMENRH